jgi:hypothetical protein
MFSFAELPKVRPFSLGFVVAIKQNSPESQRPRGIVQVKLCVLGRRGPRTMPFPRWLRFITASERDAATTGGVAAQKVITEHNANVSAAALH